MQVFQVFGCLCYAHITHPIPHKLAPRSRRCIFIGYATNMKGYRCYDLTTGKVHISRHVTFIETEFPYSMPHHKSNKESPLSTNLGSFSNPTMLPFTDPLPLKHSPITSSSTLSLIPSHADPLPSPPDTANNSLSSLSSS